MISVRSLWIALVLAVVAITTPALAFRELPPNDYPTIARADYVFACMEVNGKSRLTLEKCSCSIDRIAELLPWQQYEEAETIMSVSQMGGEKVNWARNPMVAKKVAELKRAQVEGELRCF